MLGALESDFNWSRTHGRVFTRYAVVDSVGELVVIDPATLNPFTIDEEVHASSSIHVYEDVAGKAIVTYRVVDPARYGVWAANPRG